MPSMASTRSAGGRLEHGSQAHFVLNPHGAVVRIKSQEHEIPRCSETS
jgi:hypothetical protein